MDSIHLAFNVEALENRRLTIVLLDFFQMVWDQHFHLDPGGFICIISIDDNLLDLARVEVADRSLNQVTFFVNQAGGW